ncbi:MAG: transketolase C-terminal domain-containing protein, partial [Candidatus Aminicenantales bacterium]
DRAGIVPDDGPTHQGINDIAYLSHLPRMIVAAPKDENELRHLLHSALSYSHPTAIRYPKGKALGVGMDRTLKDIPAGQSEVLKEGQDLLLALGSMVYPCLQAAESLEKEGISLCVVNARFAKPLDRDLILKRVRKSRVVITAEEGVIQGGFGSAVRNLLDREQRFDVRFKAIGIPLEVYPLGKADEIKRMFQLDAEGLKEQIRAFYAPEHERKG